MIHLSLRPRSVPLALLAPLLLTSAVRAAALDEIGITELRSLDPSLTGAGIGVAQAEATTYSDPTNSGTYDPQYDANNFEIDPTPTGINTSVPITYIGKAGTTPTTAYDSTLESTHATEVASHLFGPSTGAAPGITAVDNYNANYFFNNVIATNSAIQTPLAPTSPPAVRVVNQSFDFDGVDTSTATTLNQIYDNYISRNRVTIVTAAGNGGGIQAPGSAYNVITVGDSDGGSSVGPTYIGTSKPDLVAPGGATSFSTPYVSGTAAVLMQAAARNFFGTTLSDAQDPRTLKALLLAGTSKPYGWQHSTNAPLDPTYGAGELNAYASYQILAAGQKSRSATNYSATPPTGTSVGSSGWDWNTLSSNLTTSSYSHYLLTVNGASTLSAALTWNRPAGATSGGSVTITSVDDFDLALVNTITGATVDLSQSIALNPQTNTTGPDGNVEYLYTRDLPAGTYDLQVVKKAGSNTSTNYAYGLAFDSMLLGDANLDGHVDGTDLQIVLNNFGKSTSLWTNGNFAGDSTIDLTDVSDVLNNMNTFAATTLGAGAAFSPAVVAAPEPASLALLAISLPLLTRRKRPSC